MVLGLVFYLISERWDAGGNTLPMCLYRRMYRVVFIDASESGFGFFHKIFHYSFGDCIIKFLSVLGI